MAVGTGLDSQVLLNAHVYNQLQDVFTPQSLQNGSVNNAIKADCTTDIQ